MRSSIHACMIAVLATCALVPSAYAAEQAPCSTVADARPTKVPEALVPRVARAFAIDDTAARNAAFVRCARGRLLACYVGANLNCSKADTRRTLGGATAWCRDHPGSAGIPMYATGHETVYAWSCKGDRAVAGERVMDVDADGYVARNWKPVP